MRTRNTGLQYYDRDKATPGLTLYAPIRHEAAYLIDMDGNEVHRWPLANPSINLVALLDNGNLLTVQSDGTKAPLQAGASGALRELDRDGNVVWEHIDPLQHHDARRLPNGNTVYIAWYEMTSEAAAKVRGGRPGTEVGGEKIFADLLREVSPSGDIVWEWRIEDGLQFDEAVIAPLAPRAEYAHANTCSPCDNGDILVTFRVLNTIALVDRQTGSVKWQHRDDTWGGPHDAKILDSGNVLLFSNGHHSPTPFDYSRIVELDPTTGERVWEYKADPPLSFYSQHISGANRLESGNTLICEGATGRLFEVTPDGEIVWEYFNPHDGNHAVANAGRDRWVFRCARYDTDYTGIKELGL